MDTIFPMTMPTLMCSPMVEQAELAKAYIPSQEYKTNFTPEEALDKGTAFPELYKPYVKMKSDTPSKCQLLN